MDRKKLVDNFISEMDTKYSPDDRFKERIRPILEKLYDPKIDDSALKGLMQMAEESYQGHIALQANAKASQDGLKKICENIGKIGACYTEQMKDIAIINEKMKGINEGLNGLKESLREKDKSVEALIESALSKIPPKGSA